MTLRLEAGGRPWPAGAASQARVVLSRLRPHIVPARRAFLHAGYAPSGLQWMGVPVPAMRRVVREVDRELRGASPRAVLALAGALMTTRVIEARQVACEIVGGRPDVMARLTPATIERLGRGNDNWAAVDGFASAVTGPAWLAGRLSDADVRRWARSPDAWWRRAALVSTVSLNLRSRGGQGDARRTLAICGLFAAEAESHAGQGAVLGAPGAGPSRRRRRPGVSGGASGNLAVRCRARSLDEARDREEGPARPGTGAFRMTKRESAGLLMFRRGCGRIEVLLAHPGGPFWAARHEGAWTIPKGGLHHAESALDAAIREFREETGFEASGPFLPLGWIRQASGKIVHGWAFEGDCDPATLVSVGTSTEWPPRSGRRIIVPEIDRAQFFDVVAARSAINAGQVPLLDRLLQVL